MHCKCKRCGKGFEAEPAERPPRHRLLVGDSTNPEDMSALMDGACPSLIVTSPPYPGAAMWNEGDESGLSENIERLRVLNHAVLENVCNAAPVICWNVADVPIGGQAVQWNSADVVAWCRQRNYLVRPIIWDKGIPNPLPPLAFRRKPCVPHLTHEWVFVIYPSGWKPRERESSLGSDSEWQMRSVWTIAPAHASELCHKAPFPVELARRCTSLFSLPGDVVYDPFSGSCTTFVAGENLGRVVYGIDLSAAYVAVGLERLASIGLSPERSG